MFGSGNSNYLNVCSQWLSILEHSFKDGPYNCDKADSIAKEILGVNIHDKYIGLNSYSVVILFSSISSKIPDGIRANYLKWLHTNTQNIFYTIVRLYADTDKINTDWIMVMRFLSRFEGYKREFNQELEWLIDLEG